MPGLKILENKGKTEYVFSQSWLNTFMLCPEQARLEMLGELPRKESDATAIGDSLHTAIEMVLNEEVRPDEGVDVAIARLEELMALENFQFVQIKTPETAIRTLENVWWTWHDEIMPELPETKYVEMPFQAQLWQDDTTIVKLGGSMDFVDENCHIWDWKTANRPYDQWQVDRYKIQPTAYTLGLLLSLESKEMPADFDPDKINFHYAVVLKGNQKGHSIYSTTRGPAEWTWLTEQIKSIVALIEADLPRWPLVDQHALCSPKWCTNWANCKGAAFIEDTDRGPK